ncbi:AMP-binding protein [Actinoplanes subtropicus]|uniref:AMP-binding protein n=1 Tax=Actinoplanes subtropicus TaxID=543632 RepID=UPI0004C38DB0|nr:AMP-binding protein [Actinoplanes subtropicus]
MSVLSVPPPLSPSVRPVNVAADLAELAEREGWLPCPAFLTGDRVWTHGEVHDLAARAASVLVDHGVRPGDRVLLALPDGIGWVTAFLAVARLGAVAVLVNPALTVADHEVLAEDCGPRLCVTETALLGRFDHALDVADLLAMARSAGAAGAHWVDPDTPLYIQYTSGTTGEPKGVVHTHRDLPLYHAAIGVPVLGIGPDDVTLSVSKLFFAYGFGNAFVFPLFSGSAAVLVAGRPPAEEVAELVERHKVTMLYAVPSAYAGLVERTRRSSYSSLRAAVSAGETLPRELGERVTALLGVPVYEQIGSTEAGHAFCANGVFGNAPGTMGWPVPGFELELRDRDGRRVPEGAEGELWVHGPTLLREYLNRPAQTARVLVDGWLSTRDRAVRGADGTYRHLGRVDDMEMVGGITVSPLEVETVLAEHAGVREVAVAAVPDETGATRLRAFVVPAGASDETELAADLIGLARRRLAPFKVPRTVRLVPALPRTPTGKLRRHIVRTGSW